MAGLFGGSRVNDTTAPSTALRIQTAIAGLPIPIGVGQTRLAGNVIEYTDFTSTPAKSSSDGKGAGGSSGGKDGNSGSYDYSVAVIIGICQGPVDGFVQLWNNQTAAALSTLNLTGFDGGYSQTPWGYMTSLHPGQALGYRGLCNAAGNMQLGTSDSLPNVTFEISFANSNGAIPGAPDGDPAVWVTDLLTNEYYGVGYPSASLGSLSLYSEWARASGLVVSDALTEQRSAADYLTDLFEGTYAEPVVIDGLLTVIPRGMQAISANGAAYTPRAPVATLTNDDFLPNIGGSTSSSAASSSLNNDAVVWSRARRSSAYNQVTVNCLNRSNAYNPDPQTAQLDGEIEAYGLRPDDTKSYNFFALPAAALASAHYQLEQDQILNTVCFTLGMKWARLTPMDLVSGVPAPSGTGTVTVNIIEKTQNQDDLSFTINAELYPETALVLPTYNQQTNGATQPNLNASAGSINTPLILEPPALLLAAYGITGPQIWVGASSDNPLFGGAEVYWSLDGSSYEPAGTITAAARQGVTTASWAVGGDPDTTHTLDVDLSESLGTLTGASDAAADKLQTLAIVDNEYIAYSAATLLSGDGYQFALGGYIRRGQFGSTIAAHASGAPFCRLDGRILQLNLPQVPISFVGQTIYFKFPTFNIYQSGQQTLAEATEYSYTPTGAGAGAVQTVTIAPGAVTSQANATNSGGTITATNTESATAAQTQTLNLASITVACDGVTSLNIDISIMALELSGNYEYTADLLLYRDGSNSGLLTLTPASDGNVTTFVQDTPSAGNHTYTLVLYAAVAAYTIDEGPAHFATAAAGANLLQIQQFKR